MAASASSDSPETGADARRVQGFIGISIWGCASAGIGGIALSILVLAYGRWEAAGVALIAAGVAFGSLANALLRR